MLDLAFEVMEQAVSNSLLIFCFCNLIIVMILIKGSKPELGVDEELNFTPSPGYYYMDKTAKSEIDSVPPCRENDQLIDVLETDSDGEGTNEGEEEKCDDYDDGDQEVDNYRRDEEEEEEEEEKDDELRKRVEAFIAKVNREWKNEKLRSLNLHT